MSEVMELVKFRVTKEASPKAIAEGSRELTDWARGQPGFVSRVLVGPDERGTYTDIVRWKSMEAAKAAADVMPTVDSLKGFMTLLDMTSVEMAHVPVVNGS
ncbi:MAG: hypothetical protein AAGE52_34150 [Myxococcota bacterium]